MFFLRLALLLLIPAFLFVIKNCKELFGNPTHARERGGLFFFIPAVFPLGYVTEIQATTVIVKGVQWCYKKCSERYNALQ